MALIVSMPTCSSCDTLQKVFQCPYCKEVMTCSECLHRTTEGCEHYYTEPLKSTGWDGPPLARGPN